MYLKNGTNKNIKISNHIHIRYTVPNKYYDKLIKVAYVFKHELVYNECQPAFELDNSTLIFNLKLFFRYILIILIKIMSHN